MEIRNRLSHREQIWQQRAKLASAEIRTSLSKNANNSDDRLFVFIHLAKTGGVTMSDIIRNNIGPDDFLYIEDTQSDRSALGTWSPASLRHAFKSLPSNRAGQIKYILGHFGASIRASLPENSQFFTMLREPIERIVSGFYYATRGQLADSDGQIITLADYANRKRDYDLGIDNYMTRILSGDPRLDPPMNGITTANSPRLTNDDLLAATRTLDSYLLVGLLEQFDETLILLASDLRWSLVDIVYEVKNATPVRPPITDVPQEVRDKIYDWNSFDAALFVHARQSLAERIEAYSGDFAADLSLFRQINQLYRGRTALEELRNLELQNLSLRRQ